MKFLVTPKEGEPFNLDERTCFELLAKEVVKQDKEDFMALGNTILEYFKISNSIDTISLKNMITVSFAFGYYYRLLFEKNDVQIVAEKTEGENVELANESTDKQPSEGVC